MEKKRKGNLGICIRAAAFTAIFVILLILAGHFVMPKNNRDFGGYAKGGFYGYPDNVIDVLAVGDSNAAEGIAAPMMWKEHGYAAYVAGEPFQTVSGVYETVREITKKQTPAVLVLEVGSIFQASGLKGMEDMVKKEAEYYFPVFEYHNRFKKMKWSDLTTKKTYAWAAPYNGYSPSNTVKPFQGEKKVDEKTIAKPIPKSQELALERLRGLCREKGMQLVFLSAYSPKSWSYDKHKGTAEYARKNEIPFLDCNLESEKYGFSPEEDVRDGGTHMNTRGAIKTAKVLGEFLKENCQNALADKREEPSYEIWQKNYERFKRDVLIPYKIKE